MKFNRKEEALLREVLQQWQDRGHLSEEKAEELRRTLEVSSYDWKNIAQAAFVAAVICGLIAFVIVLRQDLLVELFYRLINAPNPLLCLLFAVLAGLLFWWAQRRKQRRPTRFYTNELIALTGGAALGAAVAFLGRWLLVGSDQLAPLFIVAALLYLMAGRWVPSLLVWLAGLLALAGWYGLTTGSAETEAGLFLGMNYPLRYLGWGLALAGVGLWMRRLPWDPAFREITYFVGLSAFFGALLLLSVFGNHTDWEAWEAAPWWASAPYSLLLAVVAALAFWWGSRRADLMLRGFGIVFFLLNFYAKFIEYGWEHLHRALFFALLALSFWGIGRRAEYIWTLREE